MAHLPDQRRSFPTLPASSELREPQEASASPRERLRLSAPLAGAGRAAAMQRSFPGAMPNPHGERPTGETGPSQWELSSSRSERLMPSAQQAEEHARHLLGEAQRRAAAARPVKPLQQQPISNFGTGIIRKPVPPAPAAPMDIRRPSPAVVERGAAATSRLAPVRLQAEAAARSWQQERLARAARRNSEASGASSWDSGDSTPTQTASSVAAAQSAYRRDAEEVRLVPVTLFHPSQLPSPNPSPATAPSMLSSTPRAVDQQSAPETRHIARVPVPQVEDAAATSVPPRALHSSQPAAAEAGAAATAQLKMGAPAVPQFRTDFHNMRRFSVSQTATSGGTLPLKLSGVGTTPGSSVQPSERVQQASQGSQDAPAASTTRAEPASPRSPLPFSSPVPETPRPEAVLRNRWSEPIISSPAASRPATGTRTPPLRPDDAGATRSCNTFGPDASMFEHARQLLQQHKEQIEAAEARAARSPQPDRTLAPARRLSNATSLRRSSFASDTTAFDTPAMAQEASHLEMQRSSSSRVAEKRRSVDLSQEGAPRRGVATGNVAPPSVVPETREPSVAGLRGEIVRSPTPPQVHAVDSKELSRRPSFLRLIPILGTSTRRPGTAQTRFSTRSGLSHGGNEPRRGHMPTHACRQCFRAGFDCALNLQLGEGTNGRRAFQDFVAAGGLDALKVDEDQGAASVALSNVLGRNYVDKLGDVAFGESALSRPVTRARIDDMLDERAKHLAEQQKRMTVEDFRAQLNDAARQQGFERRSADEKRDEEDSHISEESSSTGSDDLLFLAERWSSTRKCWLVACLCTWLAVVQAVDAGFVTSLPAIASGTEMPLPALFAARLAFLWGESGGVALGAGLAVLGRRRIIASIPGLIAIAAVLAGFMRNAWAFTAMRGVIGFGAGVFVISSIASLVDVFPARSSRTAAVATLLISACAAELAGPWIAVLVLRYIPWMWLYWIPALAACLFVPLFALAFDETAPLLRFRKHVAEMERIGGGWMPEPAPPPCPWKVVRHHVLQPYRVLGTHWLVPLSTATALIFLGALVLAMNGVVAVWVEEHGMSLIIAQGALTACGGIGLLAAALLAALFYSRPSTLAPSRRPLHIDEKGFIDSAPAAPLPEQLLFPVLCSAPAAAFMLFMLAVVTPLSSWVPSALAFCLLSTAVLLIVLGLLSYLAECYYPARETVLIELVAPSPLDSTEEPYTHFDHAAIRHRQSYTSASSLSRDSRPAGSEEARRHGMQWAVCALAGVLMICLLGAGALDLVSSLAYTGLSYATLMAIASAVASVACALPLVLLRFGARLRKDADGKIARTEASAARLSAARSHDGRTPSAYTERGPTSDLFYQPPAPAAAGSRLRQLLLPRSVRNSLRRSEQGIAVRSASAHGNTQPQRSAAEQASDEQRRTLAAERPATPEETRRSVSMMRELSPRSQQQHLVRTPEAALAPWGLRRARQHSHDAHEAERRELRDAENEQHRRKLEELQRQYH